MKIEITLKSPDAVYEAVRDAVRDDIESIAGLSDEEREELEESRMARENEKLSKWIEFSEYIRIEFDTSEGTARVLER